MLLWVLFGVTLSVGPGQPYETIPAALEDAVAGDVVEVDPGVYRGSFDVGFDVTLRSLGGSAATVLNGQGANPILEHAGPGGGRPLLTLEGFTLDGESVRTCAVSLRARLFASDVVLTDCGTDGSAGVYADDSVVRLTDVSGNGHVGSSVVYVEDSDLTVERGVFADGTAPNGAFVYAEGGEVVLLDSVFSRGTAWDDGGAVSLWGSSVVIDGCTFEDNDAYSDGGALAIGYGADATVTRSRFDRNGCGTDGGGAYTYAQGTVSFTDSTFEENVSYDDGGALAIEDAYDAEVLRSTFQHNDSGWGAAISVAFSAYSELAGNLVCRNTAWEAGAMVEVWGDLYGYAPQVHDIHHNVLTANASTYGGNVTASFSNGRANVFHNTIVDADGGAFGSDGGEHVLWNNVVTTGADNYPALEIVDDASWDVHHNLLHDVANPQPDPTGDGTHVDADPLFLDHRPTGCASDLRTDVGSPVIDAGDPNGPGDEDGSRADLGAFGGAGVSQLLDLDLDGSIVDDCGPADAAVGPGAVDVAADGVDQDCDGLEPCWLDGDEDGVGGEEEGLGPVGCSERGWSATAGDCDDADAGVTDDCDPAAHTGGHTGAPAGEHTGTPTSHTGHTDAPQPPKAQSDLPPRWFCGVAPGGEAAAGGLAVVAALALRRRRTRGH